MFVNRSREWGTSRAESDFGGEEEAAVESQKEEERQQGERREDVSDLQHV